jgi:hypothetical protein
MKKPTNGSRDLNAMGEIRFNCGGLVGDFSRYSWQTHRIVRQNEAAKDCGLSRPPYPNSGTRRPRAASKIRGNDAVGQGCLEVETLKERIRDSASPIL